MHWQAGPMNVVLRCDVSGLITTLGRALPPGSDGTPAATISIRAACELRPADEECSSPAFRRFRLKHVTYTYGSEAASYTMRVGDRAWGRCDCRRLQVEWAVAADIPPRSALHLLVLDPLSLLLPLHGALVCHAAVLVNDAGATLLVGPSGSGKSSLGFLLSHAGDAPAWRFLSDDTVILQDAGGLILAHPVRSGFGLPVDLAARFSAMLGDMVVLQRARGKIYFEGVPNQCARPQALRQIVFLERGECAEEDIMVARRRPAETLRALIDLHASIAGPHLVAQFKLWQRLAREIPASGVRFRAHCPPDVLGTAIGGH